MNIDAIFLALDGVLFDTEELHLVACNAAFDQAGLAAHWSLPELRKAARVHGHAKAIGAAARDGAGKAELIARKHDIFQELVSVRAPAAFPACLNLVEDALHSGCKLAVLTDTPARIGAALLERHFGHDVNSRFSVVAGDVDFGAAAGTGPYALALHAMGVEAQASVSIDSVSAGLHAARAAGICTVSVTPYEKDVALISGADLWCPQLQELRHMLPAWRAPAERAERFVTFKALRAWKAGSRTPGRG